MNSPKTAHNGANLIIDALLIRMSELDRYSDDEITITGNELLPLDVVTNEVGDFGFVSEATEYGVDSDGEKRWSVEFVGGTVMTTYKKPRKIRTIYETEAIDARAYLLGRLGGKKCY